MRNTTLAIGLFVAIATLAGCKPSQDTAQAEPGNEALAEASGDAGQADAASTTGEFDINAIPVSDRPLGEFPYLTLPTGYTNERRDTDKKDFSRFPFWINGKPHLVEGRFYGANFSVVDGSDKQFSMTEVTRNFEAMIEQMGGVKVSEGKIPSEQADAWDESAGEFRAAGDIYNNPVTTYVVRRNDGNIWVHLLGDTAQGWYIVGQEEGFEQTASLLPASELKKQLDSTGKVALEVNFATDKTDILPDSLPQIDQVVQLLNEDQALRLAVNGHTDNTGDPGHNQTLSEGRAQSVVKAIADKGIDASRLNAKGFGDSQPVADNGTEDGKAKNRRVELVKM